MLTQPEERKVYLMAHYWDNFNFADTALVNNRDVVKQGGSVRPESDAFAVSVGRCEEGAAEGCALCKGKGGDTDSLKQASPGNRWFVLKGWEIVL